MLLPSRPVLLTGSAGSIGSHVAMRLLADGHHVVGMDNLSDYYDVNLKRGRLVRFEDHERYTHVYCDRLQPGDIRKRGPTWSIWSARRAPGSECRWKRAWPASCPGIAAIIEPARPETSCAPVISAAAPTRL